MISFFDSLLDRNLLLFIFGGCNLLAALAFLLLAQVTHTMVRGINTWYKPFKFALSTTLFSWTMAWFVYELHAPATTQAYAWGVILLLGFEVTYIALQAGRGQLSHYNISSPLYSFLTILMGVAAAAITLWTGYIGVLFCIRDFPGVPQYYILSICAGIFLFVLFAFQGAMMGAKATHTIGGPEGEASMPVLNWSKQYGDLRIAHFLGMHALHVLPLLSWYVLKSTTGVWVASLLYTLLAVFTLLRALQGKPLLSVAPTKS